jgi:hypothetical protein
LSFFIFEKIFNFVAKTVDLRIDGAKVMSKLQGSVWLLLEVVVSRLVRTRLWQGYMVDRLSVFSLRRPITW